MSHRRLKRKKSEGAVLVELALSLMVMIFPTGNHMMAGPRIMTTG